MTEITVNFGSQPINVQVGESTGAALQAAIDAQAAAVVAQALSGPFYVSTAEGLAATVNGDEFPVREGVDDTTADIYLNNAGTAVFSRTIIIAPGDSGASAEIGHIASGPGAVARTVQAKLRDTVNIADFGGGPDRTGAQNSAAYAAAIAAVGAAGGGDIWTTAPGVYLLNDTNPGAASWDNRRCIYINTDNVALRFAKGVVLRLADNQNAHVIKIGSRVTEILAVDNVLIEGVVIDGNRANQVTPTALIDHNGGIDVSSGCSNFTIRDFHISQCMYYGIGFERAGLVNCSVINGVIEDTGADGFDAKDDDQDSFGNIVTGLKVRRFGLAGAAIDPFQSGIGFRGGWLVSNVEVTEFNGDAHGIRYQVGGGDPASNHTGGLSDFYVEASAVGTTIGVNINLPNADESRVSSGRVVGCAKGVDVDSSFNNLTDITATDCTTGFEMFQRTQGANLKAIDCGTGYSILGAENLLTNIQARGCTTGVSFGASSAFSAIRGGIFSNNGTNVSDSGTGNAISDVIGISTDRIVSATFPITATGRQVLTIAHGLDFTPTVSQCQPHIVRETSVTDARYAAPEVLSADATNVVVAVDVTTASATGGALARMVVRSIAKKASAQ